MLSRETGPLSADCLTLQSEEGIRRTVMRDDSCDSKLRLASCVAAVDRCQLKAFDGCLRAFG